MKLRTWLPVMTALGLTAACDSVDYIEVEPSVVVLSSKKDAKWLSAKAMSHTRVHYPNEKVYWSIKDPTVAAVDEKGRVTARKSGITEVVAKHRNVTASVPVEVRLAERMTVTPTEIALTEGGSTVEIAVQVFDFQGRQLKDRTPTFVSQDKEVVSMGQNAAFPVHAGQTAVEVRVEDLVQKIPVKVAPEKNAKRSAAR